MMALAGVLDLAHNGFGRTLHPWRRPVAALIPVSPQLGSDLSAAETKSQARCKRYGADRRHEKRIDELAGDADLIDGNRNGEGPHRHAGDAGQNVGIA